MCIPVWYFTSSRHWKHSLGQRPARYQPEVQVPTNKICSLKSTGRHFLCHSTTVSLPMSASTPHFTICLGPWIKIFHCNSTSVFFFCIHVIKALYIIYFDMLLTHKWCLYKSEKEEKEKESKGQNIFRSIFRYHKCTLLKHDISLMYVKRDIAYVE